MKIKNIIGLLLMLLPFFLTAQKTDRTKDYKRMEGTIGKDIDVTANFVELFGKIKGNYQYKFEKRVADEVTTYYGKMIELNGERFGKDSVRFKEAFSKDYTIVGQWGADFFNGKWKIPGEDDYMEMLLKEYYPQGSLPFKVYYLSSEQKLDERHKDSPTASIEMVYIFPQSGGLSGAAVLNKVRKEIADAFFGEGVHYGSPENMLKEFETEYYDLYAENSEDWEEIGGASFNWQLVKKMNVKFNSDDVVCLEFNKYAYTGGAHGIQNLSYEVFDLTTGDKLTLNDVFIPGSDSILSRLLTDKLLSQYQTKGSSRLSEVGFFVDRVEPNNNFFITGNGIGFQYASYEIAPYAMGLPSVFLDFNEIKNLLRKDGVVYKLTGAAHLKNE